MSCHYTLYHKSTMTRSHPQFNDNNVSIIPTEGSNCPLVFPDVFIQWLKQIDSTEAALTQKMIDLENDKVKIL